MARSILITPFINESYYTYTLQIPIGIYGTNKTNATVSITSIEFNVKYSDRVIYNENFGISLLNNRIASNINATYSRLTTQVNNYNCFAYLDTVIVSNIVLPTNAGNVYDFYLTINTDSTVTNATLFANYSNDVATTNLTITPE
jgi:hypothetical protein